MTTQTKRIIACVLLAASLAGLVSGCVCIYICNNGQTSGTPHPPTPSFGTLAVAVGSFQNGNNGQSCFPSGAGWDKYYIMPKFFLGPNVTPDANSYTNSENLSQVTVSTCDETNGTTLETAMVIYEQFHPSTDKVCATNTPACIPSAKLTIDQRTIASGKKYRATVFYKSSTLGSLTNVTVKWSYP